MLKMGARYLNTRLQVRADFDLTPLITSLEESDLMLLRVRSSERVWQATLGPKTEITSGKPSKNLESVLLAIEALEGESRLAWDHCALRQIMNGFVVNSDRLVSTSQIKAEQLSRLAAAGLALRIIIGPEPVEP